MIDQFKQTLKNQYEAALCMLHQCVEQCPQHQWQERVHENPFSQVVFHTLFFADLYLCQNLDALRKQQFHQEHAEWFDDYEQLEYRRPEATYGKTEILRYLSFCRSKVSEVLTRETEATLSAKADFQRRDFSRAELHLVNIRHIQHHTAQLSLCLRRFDNIDVAWCGSGWSSLSA